MFYFICGLWYNNGGGIKLNIYCCYELLTNGYNYFFPVNDWDVWFTGVIDYFIEDVYDYYYWV